MGIAFVAGAAVALDEAIDTAALAIARARLVLVTGLDTDAISVRAAHRVAQACGGVIDHAGSAGIYPFLSALRDHGIVMGTPAEIRRRADRILVVGAAAADHPGFIDDLAASGPDLPQGVDGGRRLFWLGPAEAPVPMPTEVRAQFAACPQERLTEALAVLRAELKGHRHAGGPMPDGDRARLVAFLREARFGVVAWAASAADAIGNEMAAGLVDDLNDGRRFTAWPLLPDDGAYGAALLSTAITGFPLRVSYGTGAPVHDPHAFDGTRLRHSGECDMVLAVSQAAGLVAAPDIAVGPGFDAGAAGIVIRAVPAADPVYYRPHLGSFGRSGAAGTQEGPAIHRVLQHMAEAVRKRIAAEERR